MDWDSREFLLIDTSDLEADNEADEADECSGGAQNVCYIIAMCVALAVMATGIVVVAMKVFKQNNDELVNVVLLIFLDQGRHLLATSLTDRLNSLHVQIGWPGVVNIVSVMAIYMAAAVYEVTSLAPLASIIFYSSAYSVQPEILDISAAVAWSAALLFALTRLIHEIATIMSTSNAMRSDGF